MISSMEKVRNSKPTALGIKANIIWGKNMERGCIIDIMDQAIQEIGRRIQCLVKVCTSGLMVDPTQVNGSITICMDLANISETTEVFMRACISTIKFMGMGFTIW